MTLHPVSIWARKTSPSGEVELHPLRSLQRDLDGIFDNFFRVAPTQLREWGGEKGFAPTVDFTEDEKSYQCEVELPGVDEKDVDVSLADGVLIIKGEKKNEAKRDDKNYHLVERSYGSFERRMQLPTDVQEDAIQASYHNGVLQITLPKSEKSAAVKKIQVMKKK